MHGLQSVPSEFSVSGYVYLDLQCRFDDLKQISACILDTEEAPCLLVARKQNSFGHYFAKRNIGQSVGEKSKFSGT